MSRQLIRCHPWDQSNLWAELTLVIDGSELPNGTATTAGVLVGKDWAVARDNGSNTVTVTFKEVLPHAPYVQSAFCGVTDTRVDSAVTTTSSLVYITTTIAGSAAADADVTIVLRVPLNSDVR